MIDIPPPPDPPFDIEKRRGIGGVLDAGEAGARREIPPGEAGESNLRAHRAALAGHPRVDSRRRCARSGRLVRPAFRNGKANRNPARRRHHPRPRFGLRPRKAPHKEEPLPKNRLSWCDQSRTPGKQSRTSCAAKQDGLKRCVDAACGRGGAFFSQRGSPVPGKGVALVEKCCGGEPVASKPCIHGHWRVLL